MTLTHIFETEEKKANLFHAFVHLNSCQCAKVYWNDLDYGIERTHALRYIENDCYKTDWEKAMLAIRMYAPRVVQQAEKGVAYFLKAYPHDAEYLKYSQVWAVVRALDQMTKKPDEPKTNPILKAPPKQKKRR